MRLARMAAVLALAAGYGFGAVHYVTVSGLGGEADYEQRFANWAKDLEKTLTGSGGEVHVHTLIGNAATKRAIEELLGKVAGEATADDAFVLMLIGHGSFDGQEYKINLKGVDATAIELAAWCDRIPAGRQLVVNMTSAGGASISALQRANRAIISATKSGTEKNATVFARYWVEALRDPGADADKNETVTALEAYQYADKKTTGFFETQKRLATEHAVVVDTAKGEPVRAPSTENGQGQLVSRFTLLRLGTAQKAAGDPAKQKLLGQREQIEAAIDKLKYEKAAMPQQEYRKRLSALLLELARLQEELEK